MFSESQESITFDEVYTFARQRNPETVRLIYCETVDDPDLPRYISALANTFGGHIIIGISPHTKTRQPRTFKGLSSFNVSDLESIIALISPYPRHKIRVTDNKRDGTFVVLDIPEGLYGPYTHIGEPQNIWILSGDSKGLIRATTKDVLHITDKAKHNRERQVQVLRREEQIFSSLCAEEKDRTDQKISVYEPELLEKIPYMVCSLYPRDVEIGKVYGRPQEMNSWLSTLQIPGLDVYAQHFPAPNRRSIPDGVGALWACNDPVRMLYTDQLYVDGSIHHTHSLLQYLDSEPVVFMSTFLMELHDFFAVAHEVYVYLGYRGTLDGTITVHNLKGIQVAPLVPLNQISFPSNLKTLPLDMHAWNITTTTHILATPQSQLTFEQQLMERIHWDMRAGSYFEELLHLTLLQTGRISIPYPYGMAST